MPSNTAMNQSYRDGKEHHADAAYRGDCELHPTEDIVRYAVMYAKQRPEVAALWCFGLGFVAGWKLKPW